MSEPTLFDEPKARLSDPSTAHEAAARVATGNVELIKKIRGIVIMHGPISRFGIARRIRSQTDFWQDDTIRSAVSRAGLERLDKLGNDSPSGMACIRYVLPVHGNVENTRPL